MGSRVLEKLKWGDAYTVRQLSRELKMDKGAVQKELYRLMDDEIVTRCEKRPRKSRKRPRYRKRGYRYIYYIEPEKLEMLRKADERRQEEQDTAPEVVIGTSSGLLIHRDD